MSYRATGPPSGGGRGATDPPGAGGAVALLLLSMLTIALFLGVIMMAMALTDEEAAIPAPPAAVTGAGEDEVLLRVTFEGDGSGELEFAPGDASCSRNCVKRFATGTKLTVTARPAEDSSFDGWGHACDGDGACSFVIDDNLSLSVAFEAKASKPEKKPVKPECKGLLPGEVNPECKGDGAGEGPTRSDCLDGRDNDGDGLTDAAQDPSCDDGGLESGKRPAAAQPPPPPAATSDCGDGRDNDGDGLTDTAQDPDCLTGAVEAGTPKVNAGGDGGPDTPARSQSDCGDGRDNDGDGLIDTAQDPGCEKDRLEADD